jgi:hypothetical protein
MIHRSYDVVLLLLHLQWRAPPVVRKQDVCLPPMIGAKNGA